MRPLYETPEDRSNEMKVAKLLSADWGCDLSKLKIACAIDFALTRGGKVAALMEVKCRKYSSQALDNLGGIILSAHKVQAGMRWADTHGVKFIIALGLEDGIFFLSLNPGDKVDGFGLEIMGRKDRGDPQDMEPCVIIPIKRFSKHA